MTYQVLDDRPGVCESCHKADYPGQFGSSARQITWNDVLKLWMCVECRLSWSNWVGTKHDTETIRQAQKPWFLIELEKEHGRSADGSYKT